MQFNDKVFDGVMHCHVRDQVEYYRSIKYHSPKIGLQTAGFSGKPDMLQLILYLLLEVKL